MGYLQQVLTADSSPLLREGCIHLYKTAGTDRVAGNPLEKIAWRRALIKLRKCNISSGRENVENAKKTSEAVR
jgi:hypothetical protein